MLLYFYHAIILPRTKDENFKLMRASTFVIRQSFNHLSDIGLEGFMNLYKTGIAKRYSFLVIDTLH